MLRFATANLPTSCQQLGGGRLDADNTTRRYRLQAIYLLFETRILFVWHIFYTLFARKDRAEYIEDCPHAGNPLFFVCDRRRR